MADRETRKITALRIPPSQLQEITDRAAALRLSRTEYMIRCALGEPLNPQSTDSRVEGLEDRVARLEDLAYGQ